LDGKTDAVVVRFESCNLANKLPNYFKHSLSFKSLTCILLVEVCYKTAINIALDNTIKSVFKEQA